MSRLRLTPLIAVTVLVAAWLAMAGEAAAGSCSSAAAGDWDAPGTWSCGGTDADGVPDADDSVSIVGPTHNVTVDSAGNTAASLTMTTGTITFSGGNTLTVAGAMSAVAGTFAGAGTATVGGSFSKTTTGQFRQQDDANLVLNGDGTLEGGEICLDEGVAADPNPDLHINATFTIEAGAAVNVFPCGLHPGNTRVHVNPPFGHLVKEGPGTKASFTKIENDGTLTVEEGRFVLANGNGGDDGDGAHVAEAGATLDFRQTTDIGPSGRVGGAGTIELSDPPGFLTLADGAVLDPAALILRTGTLAVGGTSALALPDVSMPDGFAATFDTDRPVTITDLDVETGTLAGAGSFTVPSGGSFSKTTSGELRIQESADLILNEDASLDAGPICLTESPSGDPTLHINETFTIGAGAPELTFNCGVHGSAHVHVLVNGPDGHLVTERAGLTRSASAIGVSGRVSVAPGQTLDVLDTYGQSGGLTEIAAGGILDIPPPLTATLTGGALAGSGEVDGNLTNTGGTVRPGASPGSLTVDGDYSQGSGGTLQSEIDGTTQGTQYDHLSVTGKATLDGTLAIVNGSGFDPALSDTFEILTAAGGVSGTFSSVTGAAVAGKHYEPDYNANDVTLNVVLDPPQNTSPPAISGSAVEDETLTCGPGSWTGSPTLAFKWLRDGVPIAGATTQTYKLTAEDVGREIRCRVTATNAAGSGEASSSAVIPSAKPAPGDPGVDPQPSPQLQPPPDGQGPVPRFRETAVIAPVSGVVRIRQDGRFVPLEEVEEIRLGSVIDARRGQVELTTATRADTTARSAQAAVPTQSGTFGAGIFRVTQTSGSNPITDLSLRGGNFGGCRARGRRAGTAAARRIRRLTGNARGRFRTRGRHSSATVRGTRWTVEDRCDGTLTRVRSGSVTVRDFAKRRNVVVRAGRSYLARPRAR
jgi:hypothetical protein